MEANEVHQYISEEITTTETRYVSILDAFQKFQIQPLLKHHLAYFRPHEDEAQRHLLELNESITNLLGLHRTVLDHLVKNINFVTITTDMASHLRVHYIRYVNHTEHCTTFVNRCAQSSPALKEWLSQADAQCRRSQRILADSDMNFASCCVQPVQRIIRYKMFLTEWLKHVNKGDPTAHIEAAIKTIVRVIDDCNEQKRKFDSYTRVFAIQQLHKVKDLALPSRYIIKEGNVDKVKLPAAKEKTSAFAALFNDLFLVVKLNQSSSHRIKMLWHSKTVSAGFYSAGQCVGGQYFYVQNDEGVVVLGCETPQQAGAWLEALENHVESLKARKRERSQSITVPTTTPVRPAGGDVGGNTQSASPMNHSPVQVVQEVVTTQNPNRGRPAPPPPPHALQTAPPHLPPRAPDVTISTATQVVHKRIQSAEEAMIFLAQQGLPIPAVLPPSYDVDKSPRNPSTEEIGSEVGSGPSNDYVPMPSSKSSNTTPRLDNNSARTTPRMDDSRQLFAIQQGLPHSIPVETFHSPSTTPRTSRYMDPVPPPPLNSSSSNLGFADVEVQTASDLPRSPILPRSPLNRSPVDKSPRTPPVTVRRPASTDITATYTSEMPPSSKLKNRDAETQTADQETAPTSARSSNGEGEKNT
eukprot:PhF_6_TR6928/c0_g1_i1/m.10116